ncbi:FYVE and coiled-coil domain-containing protein 1 [Liparis tanakae]|uniref:FYVE and coiled-coil domain-containing protein 1 n=1 Tax=Liparis tanakae TaxID=230148 RepID=A0A4Z2GD40_9TELE|nr:FYVE and coiled-coil domain-containing protein 1 [Liparis tanakae]
MVVGPEGQTSGEEEVRYGQVQDQRVGEGFEILILGQNHNDQDVAEHTEDDHDGEEHQSEDRPEQYDAVFFAHFIFIVVVIIEGIVFCVSDVNQPPAGVLLVDLWLKTSLGRGRAFIRYSLVHQRLADTLQQCFVNQKVTSDWYYARSPFLKSHVTADIINHLYELNQIHFDVAARGYDLDADWPTFARRTIGTASSFGWRPPSRCSSITSLVSGYSHSQVQEFAPISDLSPSLLGELGELGEPSPCSIAENLRLELDQSELRQKELLARVQELGKKSSQLKGVVEDLEGQLSAAQESSASQSHQEADHQERANHLQTSGLKDRLAAAENKNMELFSKLDESFKEKGQQTSSYCDSAWTIQELLDKLKKVEEERLKLREEELRSSEARLAEVTSVAREEREAALGRLEELQSAVDRIQGALSLKDKETGNLRAQLQDLQASLECRERKAEDLRKRLHEERDEIERRWSRSSSQKEELESQLLDVRTALTRKVKELTCSSEKLAENEVEYKTKCSNLVDINAELLQSVTKSEASVTELTESNAALLEQLASLRASEKHLKGRVEAAKMSVEDREKTLLDENLRLEEISQKALVQKEACDARIKKLERENEERLEVRSSLAATQQELDSLTARVAQLDESLLVSRRSRAELLEKLQETEAELRDRAAECGNLRARAEELELQAAGSDEKMRKLHDESQKSSAEAKEGLKEVQRLQEEVVQLRAQLLAGAEEQMKVQARHEVTESSREDLRVLAEQLKAQVEEINRRHVDELLRSREREDALVRERDGEARARAGLAAEVTSSAEELAKLKLRHEAARLEAGDSREALHRANTETAELGVRVCALTAENEDSSTRLQESSEEAGRLNAYAERLKRENRRLLDRLRDDDDGSGATEQELQEKLSKTKEEAGVLLETSREETVNQELQEVKTKWTTERERAVDLENRFQRLEAENQRYCQQIEEKNIQMADSENLIQQKEDEIIHLKGNLSREKDALWQKSDALEFEQKLRDEETERDVNYCLGCHSQFSWWLRKHSCRLCGRPFCYYCCSNTVSTQQGGHRERCCGDCYNQHSAVVERHPQEEVTHSTPGSPFSRLLQAGRAVTIGAGADEGEKPNDGVFDIITEDEVSEVYDGDSLSFATACSPEHGQQRAAQLLSVLFTVEDISGFGDSSRELFVKSSCYSTIPISMSSAGPTVSWTFTSEPKSISFSVVYRETAETPLEQAKVLIPLTRCNSHRETIQGELKVRNAGEYTLVFDNSFSRFISKKVLYHLSLDKPVVYDGTDLL